MRFSTKSLFVVTAVCAVGLFCWRNSTTSFGWRQGFSASSPGAEASTYSTAQTELDNWLLSHGFVAATNKSSTMFEKGITPHYFRSLAHPEMSVETIVGAKGFGCWIEVDAKALPFGLQSSKERLKMISNKLDQSLQEWWARWNIDHPQTVGD